MIKSLLKKVLIFIILPISFFLIYKLIRKIRVTNDLSSSLGNYLENLYDQKPSVQSTITFNRILIDIYFDEIAGLDLDEIKLNCYDYIKNFHPTIQSNHLEIKITRLIDK